MAETSTFATGLGEGVSSRSIGENFSVEWGLFAVSPAPAATRLSARRVVLSCAPKARARASTFRDRGLQHTTRASSRNTRWCRVENARTIQLIESDAVHIETILRATPAFSSLSPADRTKIAVTGAVRSYRRGAVIFEQEAPAEAFYSVISGLVKVYRL